MGMTWQEGTDADRRGDSGDRRWRRGDRRKGGAVAQPLRTFVSDNELVGVTINPHGTVTIARRDHRGHSWGAPETLRQVS